MGSSYRRSEYGSRNSLNSGHYNKSGSPSGNSTGIGSGGKMLQDVVLDHLRVGDEVVWLPQEQISVDKLDIGKVKRTMYFVDNTNQESLLALVDFEDWVEGSEEFLEPNGRRSFRRRVYAKHLQKLGEFLESASTLPNNNSSKLRSYLTRPCLLTEKISITHSLISEGDKIVARNNTATRNGTVKKLLRAGKNSYYIGVEFQGDVYSEELEHNPFCAYRTNGCERLVCIHVINLTKAIWESEFRLYIKNSKVATFEDLFFEEEAPPSYTAATTAAFSSMMAPILQPQRLPIASAPPLTPSPSPPPAYSPSFLRQEQNQRQNWARFPDDDVSLSQPVKSEQSYATATRSISQQLATPQPVMTKAYSMVSLNTISPSANSNGNIKIQSPASPVTPVPSNGPRNNSSNRNSLILGELQRKLKIQPKPEAPQLNRHLSNENGSSAIRVAEQQPMSSTRVPMMSTPQQGMILNELRRRQMGTNQEDLKTEASTKPVVPSRLPNDRFSEPHTTATAIKPRKEEVKSPPQRSSTVAQNRNSPPGMPGRSSSCLNISSIGQSSGIQKPVLKPKPPVTPKPTLSKDSPRFSFPPTNAPTTTIIKPARIEETPTEARTSPTKGVSRIPVELPVKLPDIPERIPPKLKEPESYNPHTHLEKTFLETATHPKPATPPPSPRIEIKASSSPKSPSSPIPPRPPPPTLQNISPTLGPPEKLPPVKSQLYPDLSVSLDSPSQSQKKEPLEKLSPTPPPPTVPQPDQPASSPGLNRSNRFSREILPPPPPPPLPLVNKEQNAEASCPQNQPLPQENIPEIRPPAEGGRGKLLDQIQQGVKLKQVEASVPLPQENQGLQNIIKGAMQNRRVLMDSDNESDDEYDEDSDNWE